MAKYYVFSGTLKCIVDAQDSREAIVKSVELVSSKRDAPPLELDDFFYVNEQGFESDPEDYMGTDEVVEELLGWFWDEEEE